MIRSPLFFLSLLAAMALAGSAAFIAGCSSVEEEPPPTRAVTEEPEATATPRPATSTPEPVEETDRDGDGLADALDTCPDDPETLGGWDLDEDGCPDTIADLLQLAYDENNAFWEQAFEGSGVVYDPPLGFISYDSEIETECSTAELDNAFYCGADHSIYFDINLMQTELDTNGDYGPVFVVSHEWGHLVQSLLGLLGEDRYSIDVELEADCLAGAFTLNEDELGVLEEGDLDEAVLSLFRVGDPPDTPWYDEDAHGTAEERIDAFTTGYQDGVQACLGRE